MFSSFLGKPLIIALLVSISFNLLFGYLSYSFYSDKAVAKEQLNVAVEANKSLTESLDNKELLCKASDTVTTQFQTEKQQIVKEKDGDLRDIDKLVDVLVLSKNVVNVVKKDVTKPISSEGISDAQNNVTALDDKLPESLRVLLQQSCERVRGEACPHS